MKVFDVIIIGAGAGGCFTAIQIAEHNPKLNIAILERGNTVLDKVKISGGGRCNVTHAEFIPKALAMHYPRGHKELLGPFHQFMTGDIMAWFENEGVPLKIEDDGRVFPLSNSSQTIIDCFLNRLSKYSVTVLKQQPVNRLEQLHEVWELHTKKEAFNAKVVVVATGSSPAFWKVLNQQLNYEICTPVPSLFTFNCDDNRIKSIPGVVVDDVVVEVLNTKLSAEGPLLVTHWGFSAPSILKLSAFGALELAAMDYSFTIRINFIKVEFDTALNRLKQLKVESPKKQVSANSQFGLPKRLWQNLVQASEVTPALKWANLTLTQLNALALQLTSAEFNIRGKSTYKDEFVTAGGVDLKSINFKTFESKTDPNLFFVGEVLNIDAVTGGFNFQNAWTGAHIAAKEIAKRLK